MPTPRTAAAIAVPTALAAVTCLSGLGRQPLSWDEAVTASAASRSVPSLWLLVGHTDAPLAVYYLAMHGWSALLAALGTRLTDTWLRVPSALAAVAVVALTADLARRAFGPRVGALAASLLATHPLLVFYAHDARPYTLVTVTVLVATLALRAALRRPDTVRLALYATSCAAVVYLHLFASFVLVAHAAVVACTRTWRRFALAGCAVVAAAAPLVWLATHQTGEITWVPRPTPTGIASFLVKVCGVPALLALPAWAVLRRWRRPAPAVRAEVDASRERRLLAWWALLPPAALVLASFAQPVLVARYALVSVPAIAIGVAVLLERRGGPVAAAIAAGALVLGAGVVAVQQARPYKYENFRAAADAVTDSARGGDALLFLPASYRVGYYRYLRPDPGDPPRPVATDVALLRPARWGSDAVIGGRECVPGALSQRLAGRTRIFLVGSTLATALRQRHSPDEIAKEQLLRRDYRQVWSTSYGQVSVTLLVRDGSPPGAA